MGGGSLKKERKFPVILIGILAVIVTAAYGLLITLGVLGEGGGSVGVIIVVFIFLCIIFSLIYTVYDRIREMKEQDDDEFDKY